MKGNFREKREKTYRIKGFNPDSVNHMVRFLYGFEVNDEVKDPEELFRLGDMYEVEALKHAAIILMGKDITKENVFTTIEMLEKNEVNLIFMKCVDYVKKNFTIKTLADQGMLQKCPKLAIELLKDFSLNSAVHTVSTIREASQISYCHIFSSPHKYD